MECRISFSFVWSGEADVDAATESSEVLCTLRFKVETRIHVLHHMHPENGKVTVITFARRTGGFASGGIGEVNGFCDPYFFTSGIRVPCDRSKLLQHGTSNTGRK